LSDSHVYEPYIQALFGTASQFYEVVVLKSTLPQVNHPDVLFEVVETFRLRLYYC